MHRIREYKLEDYKTQIIVLVFLLVIAIVVAVIVVTTSSGSQSVNVESVSNVPNHVAEQSIKDLPNLTDNEIVTFVHNLVQPNIEWSQLHVQAFQEMESRQVMEAVEVITLRVANSSILSEFIDEIVFINMRESVERKKQVLAEIEKIFEPGMIVTRFEGIPKQEGALGCGLSHLHVVLHALTSYRNVLCLEDDFEFIDSRQEIIDKLTAVAETFPQNRWDVIVFGQYTKSWSSINSSTKVMRLLESTTTSGYLINKDYAETLFRAFLEHLGPRLDKRIFAPEDHIDQFQLQLQRQHTWIGFQSSIGRQRPVLSIIGNVFSNNAWIASSDFQNWFAGTSEVPIPMINAPDFPLAKIAVCLVATGRYINFVQNIAQDVTALFCRPHNVQMFLFTDAERDFPNVTRYFTPRTGFPGDTLHRYDYMLKAEEKLQGFDFIFYVDVDYRILEYVSLDSLFPDQTKSGILVTTHLFGLQSEYNGQNHVGSPDTNPKSTACIHSDEKMISYFAGGFQGGTTEAFLDMCREISRKIAVDEQNNVMALWHDESHLNRYCVSHKPLSILSPSFIYPEHCLDSSNLNRTCVDLRNHNIRPIMVPLDKDHKQVRSI
jgi:histo-blood group ABO system transferase